ncbi:hypothetical protein GW17_00010809 [Ensete ventricosum]|nr:hypothetical protein GW17_00010809 [Ensete ventricosum]
MIDTCIGLELWIVDKINSSIGQDQSAKNIIGVLDIYGFESFKINRCVKPNSVLKPGIFENVNVLNQLRCGGVLEAIRISCAGYPTKRTFDEFVDRFGILEPDLTDGYKTSPQEIELSFS